MKKKLLLLLLLSVIACKIQANDTTGHTFFYEQPQFHAVLPTKTSLFYDRMEAKYDGIYGAIQLVPFGSASILPEDITTFFFPFGLSALSAGEFASNTVKNGTVAIMANYFGVLTQPVDQVYGSGTLDTTNLTFESLIRFKPKQTTYGVGLTYKQKIANFDNQDQGWWVQISAPIMGVTNDLGFTETVINAGGGQVPEGFVGSIGDALRGKTVFGSKHFKSGKISDEPITKWGIADIELSVGHDNLCHNDFLRMWYFGLIIPTGNKPTGEFIFEPIVGNNKHWGLMLGGEYNYTIWTNENEDKRIVFHTIAQSHYLFQNVQRRSFDLIDKQWSRYIWMYPEQQAEANILDIIPGINVLTRDVKVSPRSSSDTNVSFEFIADCAFMAEAGYGTYYRQTEYVELCCPFQPGPVIAGFNVDDTTEFVTESAATIRRFLPFQGVTFDTQPGSSTPEIVTIKNSDIDLRSAAHPCLVSHIIWATAGYRCDGIAYPTFVSLGGAYEFSADNNALTRYTIWGKVGVSF
ncbi:MAG: hypothetical protein P4L31_04350 [Candidatus Babeliales bacterium]|nr:hypothetical protein [Candidatus Babeliales bacterium]